MSQKYLPRHFAIIINWLATAYRLWILAKTPSQLRPGPAFRCQASHPSRPTHHLFTSLQKDSGRLANSKTLGLNLNTLQHLAAHPAWLNLLALVNLVKISSAKSVSMLLIQADFYWGFICLFPVCTHPVHLRPVSAKRRFLAVTTLPRGPGRPSHESLQIWTKHTHHPSPPHSEPGRCCGPSGGRYWGPRRGTFRKYFAITPPLPTPPWLAREPGGEFARF